MAGGAPGIDGIEIVVAGVRVGSRKAARQKPRQKLDESLLRKPEPARCLFGRDIARLDLEADGHGFALPQFGASMFFCKTLKLRATTQGF